ncbi:MAG: hypothetical protein U0074_12300 [Kouleothrix sp.]
MADAPPHLDYPNDYDYVQEARNAVAQGIKVYTIAASNSGDEAEYVLRQIANKRWRTSSSTYPGRIAARRAKRRFIGSIHSRLRLSDWMIWWCK